MTDGHIKGKPTLIRRLLRFILTALLSGLLVVVFYLAVIMGQPSDEAVSAAEKRPEPPLLQAQLPVTMNNSGDMTHMRERFPGSIIVLAPNANAFFVSGQSYDVAWGGAFARVAVLEYVLEGGETLRLESIYPSHAYELIPRQGFTLRPEIGYSILGLPAVRMDGSNVTRFHAQDNEVMYTATLPKSALELAPAVLSTIVTAD